MIRIQAHGIPRPKGSTRAFVVGRRAVITEANTHTRAWVQTMRDAARAVVGDTLPFPTGTAVAVAATFLMRRPQRLARHTTAHLTTPDVDKLLRALLDAMTGVIWTDDKQVTSVTGGKRYTQADEQPGVIVDICPA